MKDKICILSGAGISAESGLKTFRDGDGLWEGYDVHKVATPEAWRADPELVLQFYNERRAQVRKAKPNPGHLALVELERVYNVSIVTQNIDDLHERAGSSEVLHLHGEVLKAKTNENPSVLYDVAGDIEIGDLDGRGHQLRPHVVWFGEAVPEMENAIPKVAEADIVVIVGTSLVVYPAASLVGFAKQTAKVYLIDPSEETGRAASSFNAELICKPAALGLPELVERLTNDKT